MPFDPNNITNVETQARNRQSRRITLKQNDVIKGLVDPYDLATTPDPDGIMIKGPFDMNQLHVKLREQGGIDCTVIMEATYDLDYVEVTIDSTTALTPRRTASDASPTWETVFSQALQELGQVSRLVDWPNAGLSEARSPTAIRFRFSAPTSGSGKEVRIELEEGIL